jgi:AcrR family transcriptional regulator
MTSSLSSRRSARTRRPHRGSGKPLPPPNGDSDAVNSRRTVIEGHLLDIAAKRFASTGYRQTTLEDIARHAGVAKASMYRYFENKQELLTKIFLKVTSTFALGLQPLQHAPISPEEKLRRTIQHLLRTIGENIALFTVFYGEEADLPDRLRAEVNEARQRVAAGLENILREGIAQGIFRDLNVKLTAYAILGMCAWIHKWYSTSGERLEDIAAAFVELIERGCLATRGAEAEDGLTDRLRHVHDVLGSLIGRAERLEKSTR